MERAFDAGAIDDEQETRISAADFIVRAQRKADRAPVWVAVEASNAIGRRDLERARQTADALSTVFSQDTLAVVAGYRIQPQDRRQGEQASTMPHCAHAPGRRHDGMTTSMSRRVSAVGVRRRSSVRSTASFAAAIASRQASVTC